MNYLAVFVLVMMSMGRVVYPVCTECSQEIGKMIQQMLNHERFDNHKASGRDYYILKNDLVPEDPCIRFGDKMLKLTEMDTGAVFKVKLMDNTEGSDLVLSMFLVNDNLDAWSTFKCQNGSWEMVNFRYIIY